MQESLIRKETKRYVTVLMNAVIFTAGMNYFVVPMGLYSSGALGIAQITRTLLAETVGLPGNVDIAGILNFMLNVPLLLLAFRTISKNFFFKTVLSVLVQTVFFTLFRVPSEPLIDDMLASCIIGGAICGASMGMTLRASGSGGGIDILGVYFTRKFKDFSVGRLGILINVVLYAVCAVLFDLETAVYSIIFTVCMNLVVDRVHAQNINVTCMIFSKSGDIAGTVLTKMGRGMTEWRGTGAYTGEDTCVMTVVVNKYEVNELRAIIREEDPEAFVIFFEGTHVDGNFIKRL